MSYEKIFNRAWGIIWKNKFLWLLGLLAGSGSMSGYRISNAFKGTGDWDHFKESHPVDSQVVKASVKSFEDVFSQNISHWYQSWLFWLAVALILSLTIVCTYLSVTARGGLIKSVIEAAEDKTISLRQAWRQGHRYFWRILSLSLISFALVVIVVFVLVTPVALLAIFSFKVPAIILGIIFALAFIAFMIYAGLVLPLAERSIVVEKKRALDALFHAVSLFNREWRQFILFYLILFAINIISMIAVGIVLFILLLILAGIGIGLYFAAKVLMILFAIIAGIALMLTLLTVSGAIKSFLSASLTLAYLELNPRTQD